MSSTSETGHAINVSHFETLISRCTGFGTDYNPKKTELKLTALNSLLAAGQLAISTLTTKETAFINKTNDRQIIFHPIKSLATQIVNSLIASDATDELIKDARTINRKIQGQRKGKKNETPPPPPEPLTPGSTPPDSKQISVSQQSYDSLLNNFNRLIQLVASETSYDPNEADLKITALNALVVTLQTNNTDVKNATTDLLNARAARNKVLYLLKTGMVAIAAKVKSYVKSVFKASSPQYKQVSGIKFTRPR